MTTRPGLFGAQYNKRTGHATMPTGTAQCFMCRRRLRTNEIAIVMGEGFNPKRFHRGCLKNILNWSYELEPATGLELVESAVGVDPTGMKTFNAYRDMVLERMSTDDELGMGDEDES